MRLNEVLKLCGLELAIRVFTEDQIDKELLDMVKETNLINRDRNFNAWEVNEKYIFKKHLYDEVVKIDLGVHSYEEPVLHIYVKGGNQHGNNII